MNRGFVVTFAMGVILALFGVIWALQGFGVLQGSPMSNTTTWSIIGPITAVIGVVVGVIAAWLLGRSAQNLLFGVDAGDPIALVAAAVVVAAVTLGAAYIPARRAARVDPMSVLRYE